MKPGDKVVCTQTINDGFFDIAVPGDTGFINAGCNLLRTMPDGTKMKNYQILWGENIPYSICIAYENEIELFN